MLVGISDRKANVVRSSDGFRYIIADFDVMLKNGERYYTTITTKLKLTAHIIEHKLVWCYEMTDALNSVKQQLPSLKKRTDVKILACV